MDHPRPLYCWRFGSAEFDEARYELRLGGRAVEQFEAAARLAMEKADRLLALRGQVLVRLGRVEEGVALVRPALARLAQDPAESEILSRFADLSDQ